MSCTNKSSEEATMEKITVRSHGASIYLHEISQTDSFKATASIVGDINMDLKIAYFKEDGLPE